MSKRYLATVLPGLESVAADELGAKVEDASTEPALRGRVLFTSHAPLAALLRLRTVDNLYSHLARWPAGPHRSDLAALERAAADLPDHEAVLGEHPLPIARSGSARFVVNASRAGKQTYSRFEAAAAVAAGLSRRYPGLQPGTSADHALEFRLDILSDVAHLSLRLTPPDFRFRGQRDFAPGSLRPTVAHGLVWLSRPAPDDRFLDPFCGSGTILTERLAYPARRVWGGDHDSAAVATARRNLQRAAGERAAASWSVAPWDAAALPFEAGEIDTVVANLPFGRQIGNSAEIGPLYRRWATELKRVLAPGGAAWLLTERQDELEAALQAAHLAGEVVATLGLKGLRPAVVRVWAG